MNILIIGNGFDIEHNLPTKYTDFLEFIQFFSKRKYDKLDNIALKNYFHTLFSEHPKKVQYLDKLIYNNIWFQYFPKYINYGENDEKKENGWIDFESELAQIIHLLEKTKSEYEKHIKSNKQHIKQTPAYKILKKLFSYCPGLKKIATEYRIPIINSVSLFKCSRISHKEYYEKYCAKKRRSAWIASFLYQPYYNGEVFEKWNKVLLDDLNDLVKALEFYLYDYVQNINIVKCSPEIYDFIESSESVSDKHSDDFHKHSETIRILSFNYTDTFSKVYSKVIPSSVETLYHYIHGKAEDRTNTEDQSNMVLGIDEYLSNSKRSKNISFIGFQKYYQRIQKCTGNTYKQWLRQISKDENSSHLYIFGHSLDVTDRDVLCDFLLNPKIKTTIFYHSQSAYEQQIVNLVKVIGKNQLIEKVYGDRPSIVFKKQRDALVCECKKSTLCYDNIGKCANSCKKPDNCICEKTVK